jgi:hypothetical protein
MATPPPDYPVKLGSLLFTLVEPHQGHEVAYHRWYERDHFYAGCLTGPHLFAGRRWVATRELKDLRTAAPSPTSGRPALYDGRPDLGTYLAVYWIEQGKHAEHLEWALERVMWLHRNGRMFAERDHVHTLMFHHRIGVWRDDDGVPAELALDHAFAGMGVTMVDAVGDTTVDELATWLQEDHLPAVLADGPAALVLGSLPEPLQDDAPVQQPDPGALDKRVLLLWFLDQEPSAATWSPLVDGHADAIAASGKAEVAWSGVFLPTDPGTDRYTDQLW